LKTLKDLNVPYLDLWLMHWPVAFLYVPYDKNRRGYDSNYDPNDLSQIDLSSNGGSKVDRTVSIRETWEAMEKCVEEGLVKAIGVSNFTCPLIHDLLTYAKIRPVVNQVESHVYLQQSNLIKYCEEQLIRVEGYSVLGTSEFKKKDDPEVLKDPLIIKLSEKYGKSPAQICLRWQTQRGVIALAKSVTKERIKENISIFDFQLSDEDMKEISKIDRRFHFLNPIDWDTFKIPLWD